MNEKEQQADLVQFLPKSWCYWWLVTKCLVACKKIEWSEVAYIFMSALLMGYTDWRGCWLSWYGLTSSQREFRFSTCPLLFPVTINQKWSTMMETQRPEGMTRSKNRGRGFNGFTDSPVPTTHITGTERLCLMHEWLSTVNESQQTTCNLLVS